MQKETIGNKNIFAIEYTFFDDSKDTEISLFVNNENILAFEHQGKTLTTRWDLEELTLWLRNFINNMIEDPYPVNSNGSHAAEKDYNARDFDSDNDKTFEQYYQKLYDWNLKHRWHIASAGAILANIYFQLLGDNIEISWDNRNIEPEVTFVNDFGYALIPKDQFYYVVNCFLNKYADYWY